MSVISAAGKEASNNSNLRLLFGLIDHDPLIVFLATTLLTGRSAEFDGDSPTEAVLTSSWLQISGERGLNRYDADGISGVWLYSGQAPAWDREIAGIPSEFRRARERNNQSPFRRSSAEAGS